MKDQIVLEVWKIEATGELVKVTAIPTGVPDQSLEPPLTIFTLSRTNYLKMGAPREGQVFVLGAAAH